MNKILIAALSAGMFAISGSYVLAQAQTPAAGEQAPLNENNASVQATDNQQITFNQLVGFLSSGLVPDAAVSAPLTADVQAITEDSEIEVVPITELEGWTEDSTELADALEQSGEPLTNLHTALEARPDLVSKLEAANASAGDVLAITNTGTGKYTFFVNTEAE